MIFNTHSKLVGQHAFLSASKYHWLNYDEQKIEASFYSAVSAQRGTALHQLANDLITLGVRLPDTPTTMNLYVNDALGFRMSPEQVLFFSENCFGTVDAISYRANKLRIHDLKTGITPTSFKQLWIYAAIFCLEYGIKPTEIDMELRIYQNDEVRVDEEVTPDIITHVMDRIITADRQINELRQEASA